MDGEKLVALYREEGPRIFRRSPRQKVRSLWGWIGPKYSTTALEDVVEQRIGPGPLSAALREVMVVAYDMTDEGPQFFKRWRAREADRADPLMTDAAMATACAPTYFPSWPVPSTEGDARALVDGGVVRRQPDGRGDLRGAQAPLRRARRPRPARAPRRVARHGRAGTRRGGGVPAANGAALGASAVDLAARSRSGPAQRDLRRPERGRRPLGAHRDQQRAGRPGLGLEDRARAAVLPPPGRPDARSRDGRCQRGGARRAGEGRRAPDRRTRRGARRDHRPPHRHRPDPTGHDT